MTKELVLSTKDLTDVGISSQLTSNDLIEVVAHDIFQKFMSEIDGCVSAEKELKDRVCSVMQPELDTMKAELVKAKMLVAAEVVNTCYSKINGDDWSKYNYGYGLDVSEKGNGTKVQKDTDAIYFCYPQGAEAKVKLRISCDEKEEDLDTKTGGISCKITTTVRKEFEKVITVSTKRFKDVLVLIKEHNKRIDGVCEMLPANGLLSVERFTREARVKMNKKIISAQSPDFRQKISQLFNIKL